MKLNIMKLSGKKAQAEGLLENAFRIGFAMIALLIFFILVNYYVNNKLDTRLVQAETLSARIVLSDAIMLQDPDTFRTYAGIVDMQKVYKETSLDDSLGSLGRHVAAKVKIYDKSDGKYVFVKDIYLNRKQWDIWKPLIDAGQEGKGSVSMLVKEFPVTCAYDNDLTVFTYCTMVVEVIVPNS